MISYPEFNRKAAGIKGYSGASFLNSDRRNGCGSNALRRNRTLTNYIETLMKRDLTLSGAAFIDVAAPSDIREYEAVPLPGETGEERARRDALFHAILDDAGYLFRCQFT